MKNHESGRSPVDPATGSPQMAPGEHSEPGATASDPRAVAGPPDPHVPEKAKRRTFTAEYKRRILGETDACTGSGEIGALLRREGLYSSHLTVWRRQRDQGLEPSKRGRKSTRHPLEDENKCLRREKDALERRLKRSEMIIDIQKKVSEMLGIPLNSPESEGGDS